MPASDESGDRAETAHPHRTAAGVTNVNAAWNGEC